MPSNINKDTIHFVGQASGFAVGANLVNNGTFADWDDADTPTGWVNTNTTANSAIQQQNPGNFHNGPGTGACNIWTDNNTVTYVTQNSILTVDKMYRLQFDLWVNAGSIDIISYGGSSLPGLVYSTSGSKTAYFIATDGGFGFKRSGPSTDVTIDNVEIVEWVGDLNAGGGCAIENFTGTLRDYMTATGGVLHTESGLAMADQGGFIEIAASSTWDTTPVVGTLVKCNFSALFADGIYEILVATDSAIKIDLQSTGLGAETVEVWIGGAYPDIATALNDSTLSQGPVILPFDGAGTYVMKPGDVIDGDSTGATATILGVEITSGTFGGGDAAGNLYITVPTISSFDSSEQLDVGANNDVADTDGAEHSVYRKRYICVNVDQEVDAVTDFVAETSETALREDDGSRKIIGFYDSISVVQPDAGYRVVSDMDRGQTYYAGARKAFNQDEGFPVINPNGKWIELNAKGNDIAIIESNTSNLEIRNCKIYNTVVGSTDGLLRVDDATVFNNSFINCYFATSKNWIFDDQKFTDCVFKDCYVDSSVVSASILDTVGCQFISCIWNGNGRAWVVGSSGIVSHWRGSLFYKGTNAINPNTGSTFVNNIFFDQTGKCISGDSNNRRFLVINNIFSPVDATGIGIAGVYSLNAGSSNNIFYSASANTVLTNPIQHNNISPNPPLPVGTIEKDPLFVNPADGDFRLRVNSPALNGGLGSLFGGRLTIGAWGPYALPMQEERARHAGTPIYR